MLWHQVAFSLVYVPVIPLFRDINYLLCIGHIYAFELHDTAAKVRLFYLGFQRYTLGTAFCIDEHSAQLSTFAKLLVYGALSCVNIKCDSPKKLVSGILKVQMINYWIPIFKQPLPLSFWLQWSLLPRILNRPSTWRETPSRGKTPNIPSHRREGSFVWNKIGYFVLKTTQQNGMLRHSLATLEGE